MHAITKLIATSRHLISNDTISKKGFLDQLYPLLTKNGLFLILWRTISLTFEAGQNANVLILNHCLNTLYGGAVKASVRSDSSFALSFFMSLYL